MNTQDSGYCMYIVPLCYHCMTAVRIHTSWRNALWLVSLPSLSTSICMGVWGRQVVLGLVPIPSLSPSPRSQCWFSVALFLCSEFCLSGLNSLLTMFGDIIFCMLLGSYASWTQLVPSQVLIVHRRIYIVV